MACDAAYLEAKQKSVQDITIVGLGPGDVQQWTLAAHQLLTNAATVYVRSRRHPAVAHIPGTVHGFDELLSQPDTVEKIAVALLSRRDVECEPCRYTRKSREPVKSGSSGLA